MKNMDIDKRPKRKPCPICGSIPGVWNLNESGMKPQEGYEAFQVQCRSDLGAGTELRAFFGTPDSAIEALNRLVSRIQKVIK